MKIVNATPDSVTFLSKEGTEQNESQEFTVSADAAQVIKTVEPSGILGIVETSADPIGDIDGIPVEQVTYGDIKGLPKQVEGVIYIVSPLVASVAKLAGRSDCYTTGAAVSKKGGHNTTAGYLSLRKP